MTNIATIGHNNPPNDETIINQNLQVAHLSLLAQAETLFLEANNLGKIETAEDAAKVTDTIKAINTAMKQLDKARADEKEPYYTKGKLIDKFFNRPIDALEVVKAKASKFMTDYLNEQAKIEAQRRREEAERLRKEAEAEAAKAQTMEDVGLQEGAAKALNTAVRLEAKSDRFEASAASGIGLAASLGQSGAVASVRKTWVGEIVDRSDLNMELLRPFIPQSALEQALNAFVKAGGRELKGAKIYEKTISVVR